MTRPSGKFKYRLVASTLSAYVFARICAPVELKEGDTFTFSGNIFEVCSVKADVLVVNRTGFAYTVDVIEEDK
ncbi:hypothetical protein MCCARTNEY_209 [Bacillus phage vB_BanH_McCartney]|nr:hypothetical protein MCCARTNEY_209 [Bacillus phage vB_BanH_McCartney]